MNPTLARFLVRFANDHDDGTEQPRASIDPKDGCVVLRSTELNLDTGESRIIKTKVMSLDELRDELGY